MRSPRPTTAASAATTQTARTPGAVTSDGGARPSSRLDALDGLRGAAAVGILLLHSWMFVVGEQGHEAMRRTTLDLALGQLRLAVPLFFALSGFLIFRPFAGAAIDGRTPPRLGAYALRRVARIVPAYWVAMVLAFAALAYLDSHAIALSELPRYLAFLQVYDPEAVKHLNPPSWTVAVEVTFYIAAPLVGVLLALLARRLRSPGHRRALLAAVCVGFIVLGAAVLGHASLDGLDKAHRYILPARMASFGAGMLVAVLIHGRRVRRPAVTRVLLGAGVALVLLEAYAQSWHLGPADLRSALVDTPASLGFGLIIAALATGRVRGAVVLERGPLQWWGTISYGLYLVHYPVIWVLRATDRWPKDEPVAALALVLLISTVLAVASWHVLEKPAIAWARRRTPSRRPAAQPGRTAGAAAD